MADEWPLAKRIDCDLFCVWADVSDLSWLVEDLAEDPFSVEINPVVVEWWDLCVTVRVLHEAYQEGKMSDEQRLVFRWLVRLMQDSFGLMDRLGLERPDIPYEAYPAPSPEEARRAEAYILAWRERDLRERNRRFAEQSGQGDADRG